MRINCLEAASQLGIAPLQVLVELAAMNQPWEECWPEFEEGFVSTLRERRRLRMGLPPAPHRAQPTAISYPTKPTRTLPVSDLAAAILDKLMRKNYGLKSVRAFTLTQKWVHGASSEHVEELIERGNLEWSDPDRTTVNLVASKLADTEQIVEILRMRPR